MDDFATALAEVSADHTRGIFAYAAQVLGPCELAEDCSWEHRMSTVFRLRDARGGVWFLKRHRERERYLAELSAYRRWVPASRSPASWRYRVDVWLRDTRG